MSSVSMAQWADTPSEPQYLLGLTDWWPAMAWVQIQVGRGFWVDWTNGWYAVRLISQTPIACVLFELWQAITPRNKSAWAVMGADCQITDRY